MFSLTSKFTSTLENASITFQCSSNSSVVNAVCSCSQWKLGT